ncbi:AGC/Akt protein kinase [Reticulomyxa filosa]|uniref:AGC/Akt protein kinase n=1 Tax=Reticulomyxa filosa TaxID=46433 RepID=X6MZ54_RETFI|nr:AGC/Akt protein kinase [Reticulomyxa filosa]|eukprot:ETO18774.1 AGC/Akt protein kinase [Reticulomyxa filosa]
MLYGMPPFQGDAQLKMYEKILTSPVEFRERPKVSAKAQDTITSLLKKQPCKRLGYGKNGTRNVKRHAWFHVEYSLYAIFFSSSDECLNVNWTAMAAQKLQAPYVPSLENNKDTKHFEHFHVEDIEEALIDDPNGDIYRWCENF